MKAKAREAGEIEKTIKDIFTLIREGEARIKDKADKSILLIGETGAGKSTLTYLLSNKDLYVTIDEVRDKWLINAVKEVDNIVISHGANSETTIPNKCVAENGVVIWDCPGFRDTGGIVHEIANSFYIKRLSETTNNIKFLLVMNETSIDNRGMELKSIVSQFVRSFNDISILKNCVALVVTNATLPRKIINNASETKIKAIINNIKKIMVENQQFKGSKEAEMLEYLLKSVHVFFQPISEGLLPKSNILEDITETTTYLKVEKNQPISEGLLPMSNNLEDTTKATNNLKVENTCDNDLFNLTISENSLPYAEELLGIARDNINKLLSIINTAIASSNVLTQDNKENAFVSDYSFIKEWLPSSMKYALAERLPQHNMNEHFIELKQMTKLQKELEADLHNDGELAKDKYFKILEIFEEFVIKNNQSTREVLQAKHEIQEYAHVLNQQIEYEKFFSEVCGKKVDYSCFLNGLKESRAVLEQLVETKISVNMNIESLNQPSYYKEAIEYLQKHKKQPKCISKEAEANFHLGKLCHEHGYKEHALLHFTTALKLNKKMPDAYETIGEMLFDQEQYQIAVDYFKVVYNFRKVLSCYDQLIKQNDNRENWLNKATYCLDIGRFDEALKCYQEAASLSQNKEKKETLLLCSNILHDHSNKLTKVAEIFTKKAENSEDFYDYDKVDPNKLHQQITSKIEANKMIDTEQVIKEMEAKTELTAESEPKNTLHSNHKPNDEDETNPATQIPRFSKAQDTTD